MTTELIETFNLRNINLVLKSTFCFSLFGPITPVLLKAKTSFNVDEVNVDLSPLRLCRSLGKGSES